MNTPPVRSPAPAESWNPRNILGANRIWRSRGPHPFVLDRMSEIPPADRPAIKVLDVPAGPGVLTVPLRAAGFDVTGCDLFPEFLEKTMAEVRGHTVEEVFSVFQRGTFSEELLLRLFGDPQIPVPSDVRCVGGDMEGRLPFPDREFDFILCMEGIEHTKDRHKVLEEFQRILKPGGRLVVSTPNLLSLRARLAFALTGQRTFKGHLDEYTSVWGRSADGTRVYHGHAFMVNYFQLRYSLFHCGFRIRRLLPSNKSNSSVFLLPFLLPWVALFTWISQRYAAKKLAKMKARGRAPADAVPPGPEILKHVLSPQMLLSTVLILEAEKV